MNPQSYNPASDGISAKIWECMRRNSAFRDDLASLRRTRRPTDKLPAKFVQIGETNPIAFFVFIEAAVPENNSSTPIEDRCWPTLPVSARQRISLFARFYYSPEPRVISPPSGLKGDGSPFDELDLYSRENLWDRYVIVAIPKKVRDSDHRKEILAYLRGLVAEASINSITLRDDLPAGGKLLGTRADWEQFLYREALERPKVRGARSGHSRRDAMAITAWRFYEQDSFNKSKNTDEMGKKAAQEIYARRGEKVRRHIAPIENGIAAVYPDFKVFTPRN